MLAKTQCLIYNNSVPEGGGVSSALWDYFLGLTNSLMMIAMVSSVIEFNRLVKFSIKSSIGLFLLS